ncbi:MAG: thermonuclease family protein [Methylobacterium mesophilicum]|nr:thermonuclease family protein [Methylobacterium mesophilicum]
MSGRSGSGRTAGWRDLGLAVVILVALSIVADRLNRPEEVAQGGRPTSIHDGDTLTLNGEKIRLVGIDAPELRQTCRRGGALYQCGEASRDALIALVGSNPVSCKATRRDRYRRLLGDCSAGGVDLNAELIRIGWAIPYGKGYEAEQAEARSRRLGLWAGTFENPKKWRQRHGYAAEIEFAPFVEWFVRLGERVGLSMGDSE